MPWWLVDGVANAQDGLKDAKVLTPNPNRVITEMDIRPSYIDSKTDEYICLLIRKATMNPVIRAKRITIEKLH